MSDLTPVDIQNFNSAFPMIRGCLEVFFEAQRQIYLSDLVRAVRQDKRDTHFEAQLAGHIDAYESGISDLMNFFKQG